MILMHDKTLELENVDKFNIFIVKEIINKYKKLTDNKENKENIKILDIGYELIIEYLNNDIIYMSI